MNDAFITENFMLDNETAIELFHRHAKDLPIIDYHCHLSPEQVAEDKRFENMTQLWLYGDHYKWRLMRTCGTEEYYCTGNASDREKFQKWAETVPRILRNPLYHWTHMELKRPFGISDRLFTPETAEEIWRTCQEKLAEPAFSARGIMKQMNVVLVCTTDDPADDLQHHRILAQDKEFPIQVLPAFRPDKAMSLDRLETYNAYLDKLSLVSGVDICDYDSLLEAIRRRHQVFHEQGCRLSDHGLETLYAESYTEKELREIFSKVRAGASIRREQELKLKSGLLYEFAILDHEKGWTQQFHIAALRNNNRRLFKDLGPDVGGDSIGDFPFAQAMSSFFGRLDAEDRLAKTIVYSLNPTHNEILSTMIGNFQDGSMPGKMQLGSAWWFNDHASGMLHQIEALSSTGALSTFVGMLTDSRSFLSYARHEYFRRLLCNLLGGEMERGLLPKDIDLLGDMVQKISYFNAARFFGFQGLPML